MKTLATVLLIGLAAMVWADDTEKEETPWFDLETCGMCSHLAAEEGLLEHMQWKTYKTATGMMSITTVDEGYEGKFKNAQSQMQESGEKLMQGEKMPLCGMCQSFGALHGTGKVEWESWETPAGYVTMMSATDPEIIEMIHEHAQHTIDAMADMAKQTE